MAEKKKSKKSKSGKDKKKQPKRRTFKGRKLLPHEFTGVQPYAGVAKGMNYRGPYRGWVGGQDGAILGQQRPAGQVQPSVILNVGDRTKELAADGTVINSKVKSSKPRSADLNREPTDAEAAKISKAIMKTPVRDPRSLFERFEQGPRQVKLEETDPPPDRPPPGGPPPGGPPPTGPPPGGPPPGGPPPTGPPPTGPPTAPAGTGVKIDGAESGQDLQSNTGELSYVGRIAGNVKDLYDKVFKSDKGAEAANIKVDDDDVMSVISDTPSSLFESDVLTATLNDPVSKIKTKPASLVSTQARAGLSLTVSDDYLMIAKRRLGNMTNDYKKTQYAIDLVRSGKEVFGDDMSKHEFRNYIDDYAMATTFDNDRILQEFVQESGGKGQMKYNRQFVQQAIDRDLFDKDQPAYANLDQQAEAEFKQSMINHARKQFKGKFKEIVENPHYVEASAYTQWLDNPENVASLKQNLKTAGGIFGGLLLATTAVANPVVTTAVVAGALANNQNSRSRSNSLEISLDNQNGRSRSNSFEISLDLDDFGAVLPAPIEDSGVSGVQQESGVQQKSAVQRETVRV